ncbi:MAG TPA: hypothetical protein PLH02_00985 [Bacillota bacterium]|nr:hypothetical protein [Bacillota bacterium]HPF41919.1 hypothetical protein [Bacillota bacterium]HPJ85608.1 hypothetical protein [Bacillota bacterium]HPQ61440.1 hypothetical protein [Bacillota bacterium]HRX91328.1 hypothetical protein [Candidatus Izemoplasmatales bacterium]
MRYRETKEEKERKKAQALKNLQETPPEKNDVKAMIIAAFLVFFPVLILILAVVFGVLLLIFT